MNEAIRAVLLAAQERATLLGRWGDQIDAGKQRRLDSLAQRASAQLRNVPITELEDERGRLMTALDDILGTARANSPAGDLEDTEYARFRELDEAYELLSAEIEARGGRELPRVGSRSRDVTDLTRRFGAISARANGGGPGSTDNLRQAGYRAGAAPRRRGPDDVLVLRSDESLAETLRPQLEIDPDELSLDRLVRAMVSGDWTRAPREAEAMRSQSIAPLTSGGFLVPDALSATVIDLARARARVFEAGAQLVPMETGELHMARIAGDPSAAWKAENAAIAASSGTYERITFIAKALTVLVKMSVELAEDASGLVTTLEDQISASIALELDRVALRGAGADPEPRGIRNHADVTIDPLNAVPANYDFLSEAVETIWTNNGEPNAVLYSARTAGKLDRLKDTTNQPLNAPESVRALQRLVTNQIPDNLGDGSNDSEAYVGDFRQLLIGMRTRLELEATRVGGVTDGGAFERLQVWIRGYVRSDVQIAKPKHFVVATEIEPV